MKNIFVMILFVAMAASCFLNNENKVQLPKNIIVSASDTSLHNINGTWMWQGEMFNGYIIEKSQGKIIAKLPVIDGKENGTAEGWFLNGKKRSERQFLKGNREGKDLSWYENGHKSSEYFFLNDKYEGEQRTYFESGKLWQSLNYKAGYEDGKQKSWNDSGRVVNNFTVKNGKLYGVVGRYDCMSVIKK